jgi:hypothetical protein
MAGIKQFAQIDLRTPPTEGTHVVRHEDMVKCVAGLTKESVRAAMDAPFVGT